MFLYTLNQLGKLEWPSLFSTLVAIRFQKILMLNSYMWRETCHVFDHIWHNLQMWLLGLFIRLKKPQPSSALIPIDIAPDLRYRNRPTPKMDQQPQSWTKVQIWLGRIHKGFHTREALQNQDALTFTRNQNNFSIEY